MNVIPDDEWDAWVSRYTKVFGLLSDAEIAMVDTWREVFEMCGYAACELQEASTWLAANNPPQWRSQHLERIHARIAAVRLAESKARLEVETAKMEAEQCKTCSSTGIAVVPHLGFIRDGIWISPFPEYAVACSCRRGSRMYEAMRQAALQDDKKRAKALMSLGDYEMNNPEWRRQVAAKRLAAEARSRAQSAAAETDQKLGRILKQIVNQAKEGVSQS